MKILIHISKKLYYLTGIAFFITLSDSAIAQSLCTGTLGNAIISKTFDSGASLYNTAPASDFGFSTTFKIWNKVNTDDGFYSIVNKVPADFNFAWHNGSLDHSNDADGYMLLVNGDASLGEFYRDTVDNLCKGANYEFSSYVTNVNKRPNTILPSVRYEIRDINGNLLNALGSGDIAITSSLIWLKKGITFKASTPSVILVMISTAPAGNGNDIAIDDIEFRPCSPITTNITPVAQVCVNGNTTLTVTLSGNSDYQYAQWQKSTDRGITWNDTGSLISQAVPATNYTTTLPLNNVTFSEDSMKYRLIVATDPSNLADPNSPCNVISAPSLMLVSPYPILKITNPTAVCDKKIDLTLAAITSGSTFPKNTILTYFGSLANANANTNAISTANAKIISSSGTYYIKASTNTVPACTDSKPVNVQISLVKKILINPVLDVCKNNPDFEIKATFSNINSTVWTNASGTLQTGNATTLKIQPTVNELNKDSMWVKIVSNDNPTICPNIQDSVRIKFYNSPTINLPNDTIICTPSSLNFKINSTTTNIDSVTWKSTNISPIPKNGNSTFLNLTSTTFLKVVATAHKKGCISVKDSLEIKFDIKPKVSATAIPTCFSDLRVTLNGTASANKAIWKSLGTGSFKNTNTSISNEYIPSKLDSSNKTVELILTSTSQVYCPAKDTTISWTIIPLPIAKAGMDTIVCIGSSVKRNTIADVDWKYEWKTQKNGIILSSTPTFGLNAISDTNFYLSVKNSRNCIVQDSLKVKVEKLPEVSGTAIPTCLPDLRVTLNGTASANKAIWKSLGTGSFKNTNTSISNEYIPSKLDSSNKTVELILTSTSQVYCPAKDTTITWTIIPLPIAKAGMDTIVCIGSSVKRNTIADVDWKYEWKTQKNGIVLSSTPTFGLNAISDTNFYLSVKNSRNCIIQDSLKVKVEKLPEVSATAIPTCLPDLRVTLNGTTSANKAIWKSLGTGAFKSINTSISNEYIPSKLDSSNKTVELILTSISQVYCPAKDTTISWSIIPLPIAKAGIDTIVCIGSSVKRNTDADVDWKYEWNYDNQTSILSSITFQATEDSSLLYLKVTNSRNCSILDSAILIGIRPPTIELAPSICLSQDTIIKANVINPPKFGTYHWKRNNSLLPEISNSILVNNSGIYSYEYNLNRECKSNDSIIIYKSPVLNVNDLTACEKSQITFTANNIPKALYFWKNSTNAGSNIFLTNIEKGISNLKVIVVDSNSCSDTTFANAMAIPLPKISIPTIYKHCYETDTPLKLTSNIFTKYKWLSEDIVIDSVQSIFVAPEKDTFYELKVENKNGCKDSTKILVRKVCKPRLFVPNVITPESQDINSELHIYGKHFTHFEISIFNRWGEIIFNSKESKTVWNGQYLNENMPIGNYQWQVTYEGDTEEYKGPYKQTGDVAVIR